MSELPLTLNERKAAIAVKLSEVVGETHPRLSFPQHRYSRGDVNAAKLTYRQIIARTVTDFSPDLIPGAIKCDDDEVAVALQEGHLEEIDYYLTSGASSVLPRTLAGFNARELQEHADYFDLDWDNALHPTVEGYWWYRGYLVPTAERIGALIFQPWMRPSKQEGSPFPVAYTFGNPDILDVRAIALDYAIYQGGWAAMTTQTQ